MLRIQRALLIVPLALVIGPIALAATPPTEAKLPAATAPARSPRDLVDAVPPLPGPPPIKSPAYALVDMRDGTIMAAKGRDQRRAIASLTKLMTALIVVERTEPDDQVTIPAAAVENNEGSAAGLKTGETYRVDDLLQIMLAYSANDAAKSLADHVAGSEREFIDLMNSRATKLGLTDTRYTSVSGLDTSPLTQSTITDQVALASVVLRNERVAAAVALPRVTFKRADGTSEVYDNRNPLVRSYPGVNGIKTGHTDEAGYCLIARYQADGVELIAIVLGSASEAARARDVEALLDHGRTLQPELTLVTGDSPVGSVPTAWSDRRLELFPSEDVTRRVRVGSKLTERYVVPRLIDTKVRAGDEVGTLTILADDREIATVKLFVASGFTPATRSEKARRIATGWRRAVELGGSAVANAATGIAS